VNLKQAARRLGIHYQTAYKLVRSGRLPAVCVGARYEISDAAIETYLAQRQAMRRAPVRPRAKAGSSGGDPFGPALAALDAIAGSSTTVMELVADALVTHLGDLAVARALSQDGHWFLPAVIRHADPVRRAIVAATLGDFAAEVHGSRVLASVAQGETVLKALVPQDCIRSRVDAEAVQHFDEAGIHSMIVVPAQCDDDVVGLVAVTRDAPGRPYTSEDAEIVERAAAIVGAAIRRAQLTAEARLRRRVLVDALTTVVDAGASAPPVHSVLANGAVAEFVCDLDGRVLSANAAGARLFEVPVSELIGRALPDLLGAARREDLLALHTRLLSGELAFADHLIAPKGGPAFVMRFAVVRDATVHPRAIVAVGHELPPPQALTAA
jgi:excisionase family DNA binding protein